MKQSYKSFSCFLAYRNWDTLLEYGRLVLEKQVVYRVPALLILRHQQVEVLLEQEVNQLHVALVECPMQRVRLLLVPVVNEHLSIIQQYLEYLHFRHSIVVITVPPQGAQLQCRVPLLVS